MTTIAKKPASVMSLSLHEDNLTSAQKALLKLLQTKLTKKEVITKEDILTLYLLEVKGSETYRKYGTKPHPNPEYTHRITDYDNYTTHKWREVYGIQNTAVNWFKNNLGSCIIKGKLLVIPVIEL